MIAFEATFKRKRKGIINRQTYASLKHNIYIFNINGFLGEFTT
jgi:hypothetical protein